MTDHQLWGADASAYVLGALEGEEAEAFRAHMDRCPDCREEVAALQSVSQALALSVPQVAAPRELKRRVLGDVRADVRRALPARPGTRRGTAWPMLAAAGAALVAVALLVIGLGVGNSSRSTVRVTAAVAWHSGSAELRVDGSTSELVVRHMPAPPPEKVYEVWVKRDGRAPSPTSALFLPTSRGDASVAVPARLGAHDTVMVTAERFGGSSVPTTAPLLIARIT
ncbi:MAG: anti-sigma factor [Solirubrobacteraceae bacterium]